MSLACGLPERSPAADKLTLAHVRTMPMVGMAEDAGAKAFMRFGRFKAIKSLAMWNVYSNQRASAINT